MTSGMLKLAEENIAGSRFHLSRKTDVAINLAAFDCQQAIEKIVKALVNLSGNRYERTHNIDDLIQQVDKSNFQIPEWLLDTGFMLLIWEASARYKATPVTNYRRVEDVLNKTEEWLKEIVTQLQISPESTHIF